METTHFIILVILHVVNRGFTFEYEDYPTKSSNHPHSKIKEHIFVDYDPSIRPVVNHQNVTVIKIGMVVKAIDYDILTNTIDVHSWLTIVWEDEHLKWDKKKFDNVDSIFSHTLNIWTPDLSIYNARDQSNDPSTLNGLTCKILDDGTVSCVPPVKNSAHCKAKLRRYPYDKQKCKVTLGSWVYSGEEVDFRFDTYPVLIDQYEPNAEWELLNITTRRNPGHYKCCPDHTYPSLVYTFFLKRQPGFHAATIVVPAFVIMITTLLTFCLDPARTDRFYLACFNVVVHLVQLQFIAWSLPSFGDEIPLIVDYSRDSFVLCIFALVLTAVFKRLLDETNACPMWITNAITGLFGSRVGQFLLLCNYSLKAFHQKGLTSAPEDQVLTFNVTGESADSIRVYSNSVRGHFIRSAAAKNEEDGTNIIDASESDKQRDCLLLVKILDRACLLAFVIVYFCMFIAFIPEE